MSATTNHRPCAESSQQGETPVSEANQAQIENWDGKVGEKWAAMQPALDAMLAGATAVLAARLADVSGKRVLDIGCGAGVTSQMLLERGAAVTGVDVSTPMLAIAKQRTEGRGEFIRADASDWQPDTPFDCAVSQFGVMFFADPDAAFANIASALRPGGRLLFVCWRAMHENGWVMVPLGAIRDLLPAMPPPVPHAPGPFGLADGERLAAILAGAGFVDISLTPVDFPVVVAAQGGVDKALGMMLQIGPAASALAEADESIRPAAKERLREALAPHERDGQVALGGAIWVVEAVRPA